MQCSKSSPITSHQSPNIQNQLGANSINNATAIEPTNVPDHHSVGTLQRHQYHHGGGIGRINSSNIIVERGGTNTIGSRAGIFGGQTSPTSSAGSTHLIYNSAQTDNPQVSSFKNYQICDTNIQEQPTCSCSNSKVT